MSGNEESGLGWQAQCWARLHASAGGFRGWLADHLPRDKEGYAAAGIMPVAFNEAEQQLYVLVSMQRVKRGKGGYAFLGGKVERRDGADPYVTAAREAEEESHGALTKEQVLQLVRGSSLYQSFQGRYLLHAILLPDAWDAPAVCAQRMQDGSAHPAGEPSIGITWVPLQKLAKLLSRSRKRSSQDHHQQQPADGAEPGAAEAPAGSQLAPTDMLHPLTNKVLSERGLSWLKAVEKSLAAEYERQRMAAAGAAVNGLSLSEEGATGRGGEHEDGEVATSTAAAAVSTAAAELEAGTGALAARSADIGDGHQHNVASDEDNGRHGAAGHGGGTHERASEGQERDTLQKQGGGAGGSGVGAGDGVRKATHAEVHRGASFTLWPMEGLPVVVKKGDELQPRMWPTVLRPPQHEQL